MTTNQSKPKIPAAEKLLALPEFRNVRPDFVRKARSASRLLSAIGHPGYGHAFGCAVLARMVDCGGGAHIAIRREIDAQILADRDRRLHRDGAEDRTRDLVVQ